MKVEFLIQGLIYKKKIFSNISFLSNRTFHPVERSDDVVVFDHDDNNADVSQREFDIIHLKIFLYF
jgi:hypothetical protein